MARNPSISLTEILQKDIEDLVKTGRYQNVSEVMRAGARLLLDQEAQRNAVIKRLEIAVDEALESEVVEEFDIDDFLARKRTQWQST
ncbi:MAG: type II toxin-antitoxin system ParD family antitoxin [Alphaproteobacteria bacterium]|nr:type II toxin-antitoxin system ParD family antitoxin [Alphaproteobacteria bacterium]